MSSNPARICVCGICLPRQTLFDHRSQGSGETLDISQWTGETSHMSQWIGETSHMSQGISETSYMSQGIGETLHMPGDERSLFCFQSLNGSSRVWIHDSRFSVPVLYSALLIQTLHTGQNREENCRLLCEK